MRCTIGSLCLAVWIVVGSASAQEKPAAGMVVDVTKKTITIPCRVAPRKLPNLSEVYPIEVVASYGAPKGQKAHETVVTFEVKPSEVHQALEKLGLKPGKPAKGDGGIPEGPEILISLELTGPGGIARKVPVERALMDRRTGKPMPKMKWLFTGSTQKQLDPAKPEKIYAADQSGTLIAVFPVTDETVFQSSLTMKDEPLVKLETNTKVLPAEGTELKLVIELP